MFKNKWLMMALAFVLLIGMLFVWSTGRHRSGETVQDTWVDRAGHLHVLGIELGRSTLRETETAMKSRSDIALYIYPQEHPEAGLKLEAYFPSIADHSKVIVQLAADPPLLEQLQQRGTVPHLYPNRVARMNLHPEDIATVQQLIVTRLVLIPSVHITPEMLENRFGVPDRVSPAGESAMHYHYNAVGLRATLSEADAARLEFTNPAAL